MLPAAQKIWLKQGELKNSGIRRSLQGLDPGADLGGGGRTPSPRGSDHLPTQRMPLCTIFRYLILADGPQNFSKGAFAANIYSF